MRGKRKAVYCVFGTFSVPRLTFSDSSRVTAAIKCNNKTYNVESHKENTRLIVLEGAVDLKEKRERERDGQSTRNT